MSGGRAVIDETTKEETKMTMKLNTFTGTWINEKLMRAKQDAEAHKLMTFKANLIKKVWKDVETQELNEDIAFMIDTTICDYDDIEVMMSLVAQINRDYDAKFSQYVYEGLRP